MKTLFAFINLCVGMVLALLGLGVASNVLRQPEAAVAAGVALALGAACLWLAKESLVMGAPPRA